MFLQMSFLERINITKIYADYIIRQYRLGQLGVKWNQIEQYLALEKFKIDKKHSEMIYERPSLFSVQKKGEQALQDYLEKNFNLQLFNKVDSVTNKVNFEIL